MKDFAQGVLAEIRLKIKLRFKLSSLPIPDGFRYTSQIYAMHNIYGGISGLRHPRHCLLHYIRRNKILFSSMKR
jgi:hypothetical protein